MMQHNQSKSQNFAIAPEKTQQQPDSHYNTEEAVRYTSTGQVLNIQHDLTRHAVLLVFTATKLLSSPSFNSPKVDHPLLLDLGCGSGLSSKVLSEAGYSWLGTDIASAMLSLAQTDNSCHGKVVQSDMGQSVPFKSEIFDGALSISAVQWLCNVTNPDKAIERFYSKLYRTLRHGAAVALQVYLQDDEEMYMLLQAAHSNGFWGHFYVDFPHINPSKKYYICLYKPHTQSTDCIVDGYQRQLKRHLKQVATCHCVLSWPKTGSCVLHWTSINNKNTCPCQFDQNTPRDGIIANQNQEGVVELRKRMQEEHGHLSKRLLRVFRRAIDQLSTTTNSNAPILQENKAIDCVSIEVEVTQPVLNPCGGCIAVYGSIIKERFDSLTTSNHSDKDHQTKLVESIISWLLTSNDKEETSIGDYNETHSNVDNETHWTTTRLLNCTINQMDASNTTTTQSMQNTNIHWIDELQTARKHAGSAITSAKAQYFRLEFLNSNLHYDNSGDHDVVPIALLHAVKLPPLLVIPTHTHLDITNDVDVENIQRVQSPVYRIRNICKELGCSVVGVDFRWGGDDVLSAVWLLYRPAIETMPSDNLVEAVLKQYRA